jgi:ABC-type glycerol-3-phosphate transport system substrate-binding protein
MGTLIQPAIQELQARHPDLNIQINYTTTPYNKTRTHLLDALGNKSAIDLISADQIWLGDFAQRGYLTNLTDYVKIWGRAVIKIKLTCRTLFKGVILIGAGTHKIASSWAKFQTNP